MFADACSECGLSDCGCGFKGFGGTLKKITKGVTRGVVGVATGGASELYRAGKRVQKKKQAKKEAKREVKKATIKVTPSEPAWVAEKRKAAYAKYQKGIGTPSVKGKTTIKSKPAPLVKQKSTRITQRPSSAYIPLKPKVIITSKIKATRVKGKPAIFGQRPSSKSKVIIPKLLGRLQYKKVVANQLTARANQQPTIDNKLAAQKATTEVKQIETKVKNDAFKANMPALALKTSSLAPPTNVMNAQKDVEGEEEKKGFPIPLLIAGGGIGLFILIKMLGKKS